jgi:hypothetical protein
MSLAWTALRWFSKSCGRGSDADGVAHWLNRPSPSRFGNADAHAHIGGGGLTRLGEHYPGAVVVVDAQVTGAGSAARKGVRDLGDLWPIQGVVRTDVVSRR